MSLMQASGVPAGVVESAEDLLEPDPSYGITGSSIPAQASWYPM